MNKILSRRIRFTCKPENIVYVNAVLDSYGGLGPIRTLDVKNFNCAVYSTASLYKTTLNVLEALRDEGVQISDIFIEETEKVDL